jgi:DNA-binding CsgD family transcriptional regulator
VRPASDDAARERASNPLRGRNDEMSLLREHIARLGNGAGTSWLLEGGPGLGKSRLVEEAVRAGREAAFAVGHSVAEPGDAAVELAALMDALSGGPEPVLDLSALGDSRASREQRYWLLQDIQALLERSALRQPILICLDDLQWADSGTRAAIRTLPTRLASLPIGWVLAFRPVEADTDLGRAAADLHRNGAVETVLGRLGQAAVAEVIADVLGAAPDDSLLALAEGVRGNPFFLMELLSGLREEHLVSFDAGRATLTETRLPLRVCEGMRRRLARMSPATRNVAAMAASMGRRFTVAQLAAVLQLPASALLDPVQELISSELLAKGGAMLSFTHDLNREAARASQPSSAVVALDRQAASALLAAGALPVEVATQLASSAAPGDELAITTLMRATDALGGTDPGQAADLARRALDLTTMHHPLRGPLVARAAILLNAAARCEEARAFADSALRAALDRALAIHAACGARWDLARVRRRLRQLGIQRRLPAERRITVGWAALTCSELAVVRLVADSLTNREVAERLYVSPHTVNGYLRHAFDKLGINSRVALSRIAAEHPEPT